VTVTNIQLLTQVDMFRIPFARFAVNRGQSAQTSETSKVRGSFSSPGENKERLQECNCGGLSSR
jgi:hypothetical protein